MEQEIRVGDLMKLPERELARVLLGAAGDLYDNQVQRSIFGGHPPSRSATITLASKPRSAGFPGICEANTAWVTLWPITTDQSGGSEAAMRVHSLRTNQVFKIVGDASPLPDIWNEAYDRKLQSLCAKSDPVLPNWDRIGSVAFFEADSAAHASFAARVLQKTLEAAKSNALVVDNCSEDAGGNFCTEPSRLVAGLSPEGVGGFEIEPCIKDQLQLCVKAFFSASTGQQGERSVVTVRTVTDATDVDPPPEAIAIKSTTINKHTSMH